MFAIVAVVVIVLISYCVFSFFYKKLSFKVVTSEFDTFLKVDKNPLFLQALFHSYLQQINYYINSAYCLRDLTWTETLERHLVDKIFCRSNWKSLPYLPMSFSFDKSLCFSFQSSNYGCMYASQKWDHRALLLNCWHTLYWVDTLL